MNKRDVISVRLSNYATNPYAGYINSLIDILKPQSNGPLYSNTVIGTLAVDGWAVLFGTARRGLGRLRSRPVPSPLYQIQQPTHQRPVYQLVLFDVTL